MADFWKSLKRLVSTQRVRRKIPSDVPWSQTSRGFSAAQFYGSSRIAMSIYEHNLQSSSDRQMRIRDYNAMDNTPIVSTALNVYADDSTSYNEKGQILQITSENELIQKELDYLFNDVIDLEFNVYHWVRTLCKYGDSFHLLAIEPKRGITGLISLPTSEIEREEAFDNDPNSVRFRWIQNIGEYFEDYQIAHFRLLGDDNYLPYGRSVLEAGRRAWKQLQLLEDAMLIYRISRAPERRVFQLEVGNLPPDQIPAFIEAQKSKIKTESILDPKTGEIDLRYRVNALTEDYWFAKRGDMQSSVETLPGGCFALNTKIPLLDGRTLELKDIIKEHSEGKQLWLYSTNPKDGSIAPGCITWSGITKRNTQVLKLTFDNGKELIVTPEHKFPTRNRGNVEAQNLTTEDSLWSFDKKYEKIGKSNYEQIFDHSINNYEFTHRLIAKYLNEKGMMKEFKYKHEKNLNKKIIHHKDINRFNNTPENLVYMDPFDHLMWHVDNCYWNILPKEECKKIKEKISISMKNFFAGASDEWMNNWMKNSHNGLMNYFQKLTKKERKERKNKIIKNTMVAIKSFQNKLKTDSQFKKDVYNKISTTLKKQRNTKEWGDKVSKQNHKMWQNDEYRKIMLKSNIERWNDPNFRYNTSKKFSEVKKYKFDEKIHKYIIDAFKSGYDNGYKLAKYLNENEEFKSHFYEINPIAKKHTIKRELVQKMIWGLGYDGFKDFKEKIPNYNHKIIKIEWLEEKIDVGTVTVDGCHLFHDYHNLALDCGIFAKNTALNDIDDVEYIKQQLITSLGVPKIYLQFDEDISSHSTASKEDIRFARSIQRIQKICISEFSKIAIIHLFSLGKFSEDEIINFDLKMYNPSAIMELGKLELVERRYDIFDKAINTAKCMSVTKAMKDILLYSDDEVKKEKAQMLVDAKFQGKLAKLISGDDTGNAPQQDGGGGETQQPTEMTSEDNEDKKDDELSKMLDNMSTEEAEDNIAVGRTNSIKQKDTKELLPFNRKDIKGERKTGGKNKKNKIIFESYKNSLTSFFNKEE